MTLPKFDINKIKMSPTYKKLLDELNKNPIEAYKQFTIYEETSNPLTLAEGGKELIKDIKSNLKVTQQELDKAFEVPELTEEEKKKLNEKPEDAYKLAYNAYHYGDYDTNNKLRLRNVMSQIKNELINQGKDPDNIINENPVTKALSFVGNVINVPPSILAKGYASLYGKSNQVKIWGGRGWEDALRAIDETPEMKSLIEKKAKNIPLVTSEEAKVKEYDKRNAGWGLLWNIVGDPTLLTGALGKGLSLASKGLKLIEGGESLGKVVGTVGKIGEGISAPFKTLKETKRVADIEKSGELSNIIKQNLTTYKFELSDILNKTEIDKIDKLIKKPTEKEYFDLTKTMVNKAIVDGKNDVANEIIQNNNKLASTLSEAKELSGSKVWQGISKADEKIKNMLEGASEKIGLRKALVSDVPLKSKSIYGIIESPKEFIDKSRRLGQGMGQLALKTQYKIAKLIDKELVPEINKSPKVLNYFGLEEGKQYKYKELQNAIAQLIERPDISAKLNFNNKTINEINDTMDNYIIEEAKIIGDKAIPVLSANKKSTWKRLANKYQKINNTNPYHPDIAKIQTEMKNILKQQSSRGITKPDDILDVSESLGYLTHTITPEAKKILNTMESLTRNNFNSDFKSFVSNPSYRKRYFEGSITEINDKIKSGKIADDLKKELEELIASGEFLDKGEGTIDELKRMINYFDKFKGVEFFNTDVKQLIGVRGARMAKTIMQGSFYEGITRFGFDKPTVIDGIKYIKPNVNNIAGLSGKYYHPDIAIAIDRIYEYTEKPDKLMNVLKSFQGFWKALQLSYPSTVIRNMIGNVLNSFLVINNPLKYIDSWKDAFFGIAGKNYNITTSTGKVIPLQEVIQQGIDRGLTGSTLKKVDIDQVQKETANLGEGILNSTAKGIDHITTIFKDFPATGWTAKGNDIMEGTSKLALFIHSVKEGMSFDEAAENTYKALFDYGDMTQLGGKIRNIVPFFTWTRKNLPLQIGNLLSLPSKTIVKVEESINENRPSDTEIDERFQSEYLKKGVKAQVGESKGLPQYILLEGLLPTFDLARIARIFTGNMNDVLDDILKDVTPMIKTPIELAVNRSFATRKDLEKSQYGTTEFMGFNMSPKLKAVLDDWRIFGTLNKGLNIAKLIGTEKTSIMPEKNVAKMVFAWALASPLDYDVNFSRIIASSEFKGLLNKEINDFYGYGQKIQKALLNGEQFPSKIYRNRLALILGMLIKGYKNGKLSDDELKSYGNKLYSSVMGMVK